MPMPRPDAESKAFFQSMLPTDPRVSVRPMFGNLDGLVNGNMFMGLFGSDFFVRLLDSDRTTLIEEEGASELEPMPGGRPMKEYVVIPQEWRQQPDRVEYWVLRSMNWVGEMPVKKGKKNKKK